MLYVQVYYVGVKKHCQALDAVASSVVPDRVVTT